MSHAEREALQLDLEVCCLSLILSVFWSLSLAGDRSLSEPERSCICLNAPCTLELTLSRQCQTGTSVAFAFCASLSCRTPFVFSEVGMAGRSESQTVRLEGNVI